MNAQSLSSADPRTLGRYELLGRLGWGSQGIVFLARDPDSGTQVAVKLLRAHLDGDDAARLRFLREVEAAKRVAPFCTAQVLDANVAGTQPYIVSEYIPGPSLAEVIRSDGPRAGGALHRIAINTATALGAIHHAGVVHRDFKAANVLLGPDGPVVIDFGVAKELGSGERQLTLTGQQIGTPAYMAPEQFKDQPAGPGTDIFAWGVTMAFAATGTLPFGDVSIPSVMHKILHEEPDLGDLNGPMRDLVAACLAKDPAGRPTARQIIDRLMSAVNVQAPAAAEAVDPGVMNAEAMDVRAMDAGVTGAGVTGAGAMAGPALWTTDPLHKVRMSAAATRVTPPAARGRLRSPWTAVIGVAVVIVVAGGILAGTKAFTSPGSQSTGPGTGGKAGSSGVATVSGASGYTATDHYDSASGLSAGGLAPAGDTAGIPYFKPVKGDWDSLDGVRRCVTVGRDKTTEGIICLGLLEGNSGGGVTWYTPALTAYCETIATSRDVKCGKITGHFGMYSATGVQEAPREYAACGRSHACGSGANLFVDDDGSAWMTVRTAAALSCQDKGGQGTDCEIYPYAYAGLGIELPGTDKTVTLGEGYKGPAAIGY